MFRAKDRDKCQQLFDRYYSGHRFYDAVYQDTIRKYLFPGARLLDAGCGRYLRVCKEFAGIAEVVGIDLETTLETRNDRSPFGVRGDLDRLPFPSGHFDLIITRQVVEHLADPPRVFREFCRVVKPGGKVIVVTPNKHDYVSVIAAATPYMFHRALVSRLFLVPADDVFPTLYRANTISALGKALKSAGFVETEFHAVNHYPAYLMISPILFRLGVLYERLTSLRLLRSLRSVLLCVFEKPAASALHSSEGIPREVTVTAQV